MFVEMIYKSCFELEFVEITCICVACLKIIGMKKLLFMACRYPRQHQWQIVPAGTVQ
jgi:hypothetical protein